MEYDMPKIGVSTSTTNTKVFDMLSFEEAKGIADERVKGLVSIFQKKIGKIEDITVIMPISSELFKVMGMTLSEFMSVVMIDYKIWNSEIVLPNNRYLIFLGFWGSNPLEDWIKRGIIKKEHYVMSTAKDPIVKQFLSANSIYIDIWANAQMNCGVKFPDCDKYHWIQKPIYNDPTKTFVVESKCKCGIEGETFSVEEKLT
jgi:hypothetical protein